MKKKILQFFGIEQRLTLIEADKRPANIEHKIDELEKELRLAMKYIGALYDYLEVRPQRTFTQDYSRLPQEEYPTMEIIKAHKVKKNDTKSTK